MVVLVIVGVLMAVAILSFGILADDDNMDREARRLSSLIQLVTDEATTQGRDFGVEFMTAGYRFVEHDPLARSVVRNHRRRLPRATGTWKKASEFELYLEERKVLLHTDAQETAKEKTRKR